MNIRTMTLKDIDAVVPIHRKTLATTVSSKMGEKYLKTLYKNLLINRDIHIAFVSTRGNTITGAVTATTNFKKTQAILNPLYNRFILFFFIKNILLGKINVLEVIKNFLSEIALSKKTNCTYPCILTLFVLPKYQNQHIGNNLVQKLINTLNKLAVKEIYVSTLINNATALSFYKKMGFYKNMETHDSIILSRKIKKIILN